MQKKVTFEATNTLETVQLLQRKNTYFLKNCVSDWKGAVRQPPQRSEEAARQQAL